MIDLISAVRPYLEAAYFSAGILVLLGLVLAARQLNLLRLDVNLRNERAAKEKAIVACERYLGAYVEKSGELLKEKLTKKFSSYHGPIGDFSKNSIPRKLWDRVSAKLLLDNTLPVLNELEAIAASFGTGVADEKTGFQIIGRSFCSTVESEYDLIAICRDEHVHNYWSGIVEVYSIWRPRLTKAEMESAKSRLQQKIDSMKEPDEIRPFGVS